MIKTLFFFYCFILVLLVTVGAGLSIFSLLLLPITVYFISTLLGKIKVIGRLQFPLKGFLTSTLTSYSFIVITIMTISGLLGAKNIAEVISGAFFLPLTWYFAWQVLPKRNRAIHIPALVIKPQDIEQPEKLAKQIHSPAQKLPNIDVDRRQFLKLISSAGLSLFLFSIFAKKAQAAFFGSVPGPGTVAVKDSGGALVDPAISTPTDGYKITELDDSSPAYYGYLEKTGKWFIMKENAGAYRYTKGNSSFTSNWTNRASLTYDYFDAIF